MFHIARRVIQPHFRKGIPAISFSTKNHPEDALPSHRRLKSMTDSLSDRGFLRSYKAYSPPDNVNETVSQLAAALELTLNDKLTDLSLKCELLQTCAKTFNHQVPNSVLHEVQTVEDVIDFYSTPVDSTLPMDRIQNVADLPKNLHIQQDYVRYSPEDPMFERSAFPKSSTLVSGISTRRKYKGHEAKRSWY